MWSEVINSTSWMLVWFLLASIGFFLIQESKNQIRLIDYFRKRERFSWLIVLIIALAVRLLPMVLLPVGATYDIDSFRMVADALLTGKEVYQAASGRHPYLPLQMYLIGATLWGAVSLSLPFVVMVKLPAVLADVGITAVIYQSSRKSGKSSPEAAVWALIYALNPISILVSAYHGQFDAIPVLLLLLSWYYWKFGKHTSLSAIALGFAVLSKTWPIIFWPIIFLRLQDFKQRLIYTLLTLGIPITFTLAYLAYFDADPKVLIRPLTHTGVAGYWGASAILAIAAHFRDGLQNLYTDLVAIRRWLLLIVGLFTLWHTRKHHLLDALTTLILGIFAISVGMGIQWMLWVVPFALLSGDLRGLKWYSIFGSVFLLTQLYGIHMYPWAFQLFPQETADLIIRAGSIPAWIMVVMWFGIRLRSPKKIVI